MVFYLRHACFSIATYGLLFLLWLAAGTPAAAQPATHTDSLQQALATAPHDTVRVKLLHELAVRTAEHQPTQALRYARQGLAEARRLGWRPGEAQSLQDIGLIYWRQGDFGQTQHYLLAALTVWRSLRQQRPVLRTMLSIAEVLGTAGQFGKAIEWQEKALDAARAAHDTLVLADAYMGMGLLHRRQNQLNSTLTAYQQALAFLRTGAKDPRDNALAAVVLNNIADAHVALNQPQAALPHAFRAVKLGRKHNVKSDVGIFETTLAEVYGKLGKWDMAIYHARNAQQLSTETNDISTLILTNNLLDTLYAQKGDYRMARRHAAQSRALETKARLEEQKREVAEVQGRYDTQEKERNIKLLRQQNQIARLATLQQRTLRNAALAGVGLLLLLVAVLYNRYRLRQRTVRLLDQQNQEKEQLLREKTLLLQEVHHRVKNNLQIVLSLLSNQLDTQPDPAAAAAIRESQSRVQTMALIHQNLYQADNLARIDMRRYLAELLDAIGRTFRREEVALTLDVAPMHLTTHTAVPLGLIVNELVTNAYKYAFTGRQHNTLRVELRPLSATTYCLVVADNGIGLPPLDLEMAQSLGLRLTAGLVRQMHAQLTIHREAGTQFHIVFQEATDAFGPARPRTSAGSEVSATA